MQEKKRILIFDTILSGHHIEYLHHLYLGAIADNCNNYIFAVPEMFQEKKTLLNWPKVSNIDFYYIKQKDIDNAHSGFSTYRRTRLLGKVCKKTQPTNLFLIFLMSYIPFIYLFVSPKIKVSGIIYRIYLYDWKNESIAKKIKDLFAYFFITKSKRVHKAFILNDDTAAKYLNHIWSTTIFCYLPDPYVPYKPDKTINLRKELDISNNKRIFLHLGSISKRKGTLSIFKIAERIPQKELNNYCFIIAGKISETINKELFLQYNRLKNLVQIVIIDKFLSYDDITNLCESCDYILLPYLETSRSSGIIGYGAQFGKPVIVPKHGLLGKLVAKYNLGICLKNEFIDSFINKRHILLDSYYNIPKDYLKEHTIESFYSIALVFN